jgi:cysteine-rich repeat protein
MLLRLGFVLGATFVLSACGKPTCANLDDGNPCTEDLCSNGVVRHTASTLGTTCDTGTCDGNGACVQCLSNFDCAPNVCNLATNTCSVASGSCTDALKNGDETGVDCGGSCAPTRQCATNGGCLVAMDCASGVCTANKCVAAACGDGIQQMNEGCDDGNQTNGDGCDDGAGGSCRPTGCGNGTKTGTEACDDGNAVNGDGCDLNCTVTRCGNGSQAGTEQCDDGNAMGGDGCSAGCRVEPGYQCTMMPSVCTSSCGDGATQASEECDDGNRMGGDGCSMNCLRELGFACTGSPSSCATTCGDGIPVGAETCDDMNTTPGDGCAANCLAEPGYQCAGLPSRCVTRCGDGLLAGAERCDDGNIMGGDGCSATCATENGYVCSGAPSVCSGNCGDGLRQANEQCDDANLTINDGCSDACTIEPGSTCTGTPSVCTAVCGDGIRGAREACDDMNLMPGDGCSATCTVEVGYSCTGTPSVCTIRCGDGTKAASEGCDDGNVMSGDGCSMGCTIETGYACTGTTPSACTGICGDGLRLGLETCDQGGGNVAAGDGCSATCIVEFAFTCAGTPSVCTTTCGDGLKASTEGCDDGDLMGTDGCSATCTVEPGWSCSGTMPSTCVMRAQTCGDGFIDVPEQCDDGNTRGVDGCSATCRTELTEIEPNEDGTPQTGGTGIAGNDFNASAVTRANANFLVRASTGANGILAAFSPAGDEDVFAVTNDTLVGQELRVDLWNRAAGYGQGVPCGTSIDTGLHVRNAAGTSLASNDDRNSTIDQCSGLLLALLPGQTVYVHTMEYGDDLAVPAPGYGVELRFTPIVCGNGSVYPGIEECDDGNRVDADACSNTCRINAVDEVEANDTRAQANTSSLQVTGSVLIRGAIGTTTDVDVFRVVLATDSVVRFETFTQGGDCTGGVTTNLRLLSSTGASILTDATSGIASCSAIVTFLPAGTYYIQAEESGVNAAIARYFLEVAIQPNRGTESETAGVSGINDTIGTAEPALVSHRQGYGVGDHSVASDIDVWAITVPAGNAVRIELIEGNTETCESAGVDSVVQLLNASGTELAYSDDDGRGNCSLIDGTGTSPVNASARNTGTMTATMYVQVRGFSTTGVNSQFAYRLQVTIR